ncbi:sodium:dicarboxylate symporter (plasmid) [Gemmatirosa kalamazoonensis]|uniref:Sodium:dicarboxylate symporter n=2 Tax=Gemmatirosa kalamazoonensis TaxID=861299 RepID=W0RRC3_9BACT|nr:sodium:dicarboxylate symporter [Gemmatirosa kalamazoonensis]
MGGRLAAGFALGALTGALIGPPVTVVRPLGDLLVRLLTVLVLPIVVCTIVTGLGAITPEALRRVGARSVALYAGASAAATALGLAVALLLRPGAGMTLPGAHAPPLAPPPGSFLDALVPANVVAALAEGQLLPVMVFTVPFALAIARLRRSGAARQADTVHAFFDGCGRASHVMLEGVMYYAPIGTFALAAMTFAPRDGRVLAQFATVLLAIYVAESTLCAALLLLLTVSVPPRSVIPAVRDVLVTAFATGSSAATLPMELEAAERRLGVDRRVFAFTLPLGVAVSKVGSAAYLAVACVFAANAAGIALVPGRVALIGALVWVGSVMTPPVGLGALVVLGFVLSQAGLPAAAAGVVAAIPFAGRLNTPVNSLGRLATTTLVARATESVGAQITVGALDAP